MAGERASQTPLGLVGVLFTAAACASLLVLSILHYVHGARLTAIELSTRHCAENGDCQKSTIERFLASLSEPGGKPDFLDTGSHYTQGLLYDYLAADSELDRPAQLAMRERAIEQFRAGVADRPLWSSGWFALANDYLLVGRFDEAEAALSALLDREPYPSFHLEFLRLAFRYSVLWTPPFRERLATNLCSYLNASDWGGRHIRLAVEHGMAERVRGCLHNAWQEGVLKSATEQLDAPES